MGPYVAVAGCTDPAKKEQRCAQVDIGAFI
jgi:hypothetical protein